MSLLGRYSIAGRRARSLDFRCRDNETRMLKPVSKTGSRRKYCRQCPALQMGKCLFGQKAAYGKLIEVLKVSPKKAKALARVCDCGAPCDDEFKFCGACRLERDHQKEQSATRIDGITCAFPEGCDVYINPQNNKSRMCLPHARVMQARRRAEALRQSANEFRLRLRAPAAN